ncbi:hypothetical protein ABW19_dt0207802 [Dactylella cylindrospora]|nr:hypothetical protein ABW19_dt0207802 [Dactylella cylindrospora]
MSTTSTEISERIALLTDAYQEVITQIDRLANLTGVGTEAARNELAGVIHQSLKDGDGELETLSLQISTLNPSTEPQTALEARLNKLQEEYKAARINYRKSLLHSKRTSALNARKERELLHLAATSPLTTSPTSPILQSPSGSTTSLPLATNPYTRRHQPKKDRKDMTQQELLTSASSDVTQALRRTHALMSSELARSRFAAETLAESTETLKQLGQSYSAFDNVLVKSRGLITDLVKKNKSDMWYYQMSLYVLVGTIAWLIFRRLLWGPVYLLVWLPLRVVVWAVLLPFKGGKEVAVPDDRVGGVKDDLLGEVKSEVEKVVEGMKVTRRVETNDGGGVEEVKRVTLSNGEEVEIRLDPSESPEGTAEAASTEGTIEESIEQTVEGAHDEL